MSASGERTLRVLEYLAREGDSALHRVAVDLGLNKTTAHRLLGSLVAAGYVRQDVDTRTYGPTTKVLQLANSVLDRIDIRRQVHQHLRELADATGETAHLAVLEDLQIVYADKVDGRQAVTMKSRVGDRGLCHSTSLGKVLLAFQPESQWRRYVRDVGLSRRTANTVVDPATFYDVLHSVRRHGNAVDDVENEDGLRCVAAPVRDHTGAVVAAMSISGWTLSMTAERSRDFIPVVVAHAHKASTGLGYDPAGRGGRDATRER